MFSFNSPSALAVSAQGLLSRLKFWLRPDHGFEVRNEPSHVKKTSHGTILNPTTLLSLPSQLSLDLPSPTISLSFAFDSDSELETESEASSTENSRCHTPLGDYSCVDASLKLLGHATELSLSKITPAVISTDLPTTLNVSRGALLTKYSYQELVLLEFITHTSDVQAGGIDSVLLKFPPGFSHACRCVGMVEEGNDLCEVCQLLDAYMDYSLERFRGMDLAA